VSSSASDWLLAISAAVVLAAAGLLLGSPLSGCVLALSPLVATAWAQYVAMRKPTATQLALADLVNSEIREGHSWLRSCVPCRGGCSCCSTALSTTQASLAKASGLALRLRRPDPVRSAINQYSEIAKTALDLDISARQTRLDTIFEELVAACSELAAD